MAVLVGTGVFAYATPAVEVVLAGHTFPWWVPLLWVIVVATAAGYAFGVRATSLLGSRVASFVGLTEVLFALLIAWLVIGEVPSVAQALGGALILSGVILVRADSLRATRGAPTSAPLAPTPSGG